jgi:hypothetical protein
MLRRLLVANVVLVIVLGLGGCGGGGSSGGPAGTKFASAAAGTLRLSQGWVAETGGNTSMPGMDMGSSGSELSSVAYATLTNDGSGPDALVSVSTSAASSAMLHDTTTSSDGSSGTMTSVRQITIPAAGSVMLHPGGYHVMLTGLAAPLEAGGHVTMSWRFRSGAVISTTFPVINREDRPAS